MMSTAPRIINAYAAFEQSGEVKPWQYQSRVLGAEDVEIKITHCGICGSDIIGEITIAGVDVKHLAVGDRVGVGAQVWACLNKDKDVPCDDCADGADAYCKRRVWTYNCPYEDGAMAHGGYADFVRVSSHHAFKIPDNIPSDVATPLLCAGATVFTPLKTHKVKAGDRVGVIGIGGLGHLAIQFIRALGAVPIAFSRSANKEQEILGLGAKEFYNLSNTEDAARAASSVNMLIITADANNMPYDLYMGLVRPRGTCVMLGLPNDRIQFTPFGLVPRGINFAGSAIGSIADVKDMLALAAKENVRPIIQKMPMTQVNEGLKLVRNGTVRYRVVLEN